MPTKNLVTDFGGVGDGQRATLVATISSGTGALSVGAGTGNFATGDVGHAIAIWSGSNYYFGAISARSSADAITITPNITFALAAASSDILWGTDNTNALTGASGSWRAYAQTQTNPADIPILQIPDGSYAYKSSAAAGGALHYNVLNSAKVSGISGVAANCKLMQFSNSEMRFGTDPAIASLGLFNGGNSVRLQTASSGAGTVTLASPSGLDKNSATYGARVVVGRVCLLACFDAQGINNSDFGFPPNSYFFEWNVISAYNSGTGGVTLQNPLTQAYKSTYPQWGPDDTSFAAGHSQGADQGGPFTMWIAPDGYNNTVTLENVMIDSPHNQCACHMRNWVANNIDTNGGPGLYPTQNDIVTINNSVYSAGLEIDKMTNQVTWNNCTINRLIQQSASPNRMIVNGGTIGTLETAKYTEANNVAFTGTAKVTLGVSAFGRAERLILNGCTGIATFQRGGATTDDLNGNATGTAASSYYSFVSGVIKFLKSSNDSAGGTGQQNLTRCFVPGTWLLFDDKYIDQVTDVYEDGTYCYVKLANTTNWPLTPVSRLKVHPCPDITVRNCTGTAPELEDYNQAPARIPYYSYSKRTYVAGASAATPATAPFILGKPTSIKFTVSSLFTGGTALTFNQFQFSNGRYLKQSDYSLLSNLGNTINMKTGLNQTRVVANLAAGSNPQTGDTLFDFSAVGSSVWFYTNGFSAPNFSANVSNGDTPTVTVEWIMDQGIPPAIPSAVVPLRFRLRAA